MHQFTDQHLDMVSIRLLLGESGAISNRFKRVRKLTYLYEICFLFKCYMVRIYHAFKHLNIKAKANQLNMEIGDFFALLALFLKIQNLQNKIEPT